MQYYVVDTTSSPDQVLKFNTYPEIVNHLEIMSKRRYRKSRKERMIDLEEVGHGPDDRQAVNFVRSMAEVFNLGIVRDEGLMRCDITAVEYFQKEEYGS
jgi:hypothetical protein